MLWWNVFQQIVSIHQIETLLERISFCISGFEMFAAISKLLKHPVSTFSRWKKNNTIFSSKSLLSKCKLIMGAISKLRWKYCKWHKIKLVFVFLFLISDNNFQEFCFLSGFENGKIVCLAWLTIQLVQFVRKVPSVGYASV